MSDLAHESRIYSTFSAIYDRTFGAVFAGRISRVLREMAIPVGSRVLEVGVGTGLSLAAYPLDVDVVGVDLSPEMLQRAERKVEQAGWDHISLEQGDAQNLRFEDEHFDYVTSFHVVSVVPDPAAMVREMVRVCRPGGHLVIINHFRSPRRPIAAVVDSLDPITRRLGWRTTLRGTDLLAEVELEGVRTYKTSPTSLFTVLIAKKPEPDRALRAFA